MGAEETRPQLLLGAEEVAAALSVGRTTARELIASGKLASVRIGTRRLVARVELERYVDQLASGAA